MGLTPFLSFTSGVFHFSSIVRNFIIKKTHLKIERMRAEYLIPTTAFLGTQFTCPENFPLQSPTGADRGQQPSETAPSGTQRRTKGQGRGRP